MTEMPPADWYTDPEDDDQYRYWDGSRWTEHRAPRHSADAESPGAGHRSVGELLAGTWRLAAANWRPLVVIYAVVAVVYLAAEQAITSGYGQLFGDTLEALFADIESLDGADSDEDLEVLENSWNDVTDRLQGLGSSALARGVLLLVLGFVVATVVNVVEFTAVGQFAVARLAGRTMGAVAALRAGLARTVRFIAVGLMLCLMLTAVLIAVGVVVGIAAAVTGVAGVAVMAVLVVVALLGAVPLVLLTLMTAAAGPAEPSVRYARNLLRGFFWATMGRMVLLVLLATVASLAAVAVAEVVEIFSAPVASVVLVVLAGPPEVLFTMAMFTLYHDLGGRPADT